MAATAGRSGAIPSRRLGWSSVANRRGRATVWWNGLKIHDNAPISKANGGVPVGPSKEGLKLQEHGQDVRFRNIWIKERSAE